MHANEVVIRDFYEAQGRYYAGETNAEAVEALLADHVVWHVPGHNAIAGDYRGRQAVLDYFTRRRDKAGGSLRVVIHRVLADDELAVQLARGQAELGGAVRRWETVGVYRIADGRIVECWLIPFDQHEFDDIWS